MTEGSITACVITLSDTGAAGEREDTAGPLIAGMLGSIGAEVAHYEILPDEKPLIKDKLMDYSRKVDLIVTTGGTGLSPRDVTPEATREVIEREVPGMAEAMRAAGLPKTRRAMLTRGVAGVRGRALIINLPGSPKAARENLEAVLEVIPHAVGKIQGSQEECAR
jgi:molybdenum cofactor synthesis domain-containing protein